MKKTEYPVFEGIFLIFCIRALIFADLATTAIILGLICLLVFRSWLNKDQKVVDDNLQKKVEEMSSKINALHIQQSIKRPVNEIQQKRF
jgi:hypothetical protein